MLEEVAKRQDNIREDQQESGLTLLALTGGAAGKAEYSRMSKQNGASLVVGKDLEMFGSLTIEDKKENLSGSDLDLAKFSQKLPGCFGDRKDAKNFSGRDPAELEMLGRVFIGDTGKNFSGASGMDGDPAKNSLRKAPGCFDDSKETRSSAGVDSESEEAGNPVGGETLNGFQSGADGAPLEQYPIAEDMEEEEGELVLEENELVLEQRKSESPGVQKGDGVQKPGAVKESQNPKEAGNAKIVEASPVYGIDQQEGELVLEQVKSQPNKPGLAKENGLKKPGAAK